jgi:hypothetical protein
LCLRWGVRLAYSWSGRSFPAARGARLPRGTPHSVTLATSHIPAMSPTTAEMNARKIVEILSIKVDKLHRVNYD